MILLTSQTDNQVGIAQGFVKSINKSKTAFTLLIDKNLNAFSCIYTPEHLFRVDKINFRSAISLNYTNLARLMSAEKRSVNLRAYIVDKTVPAFDTMLPKQQIMQTKDLFKKLNKSQQAAILKVNPSQ